SDQTWPETSPIRRYIYEPDAAVLAAQLASTLCQEHDLAAISPGIAYLTSDSAIDDPMLDCFEVIDTLPLDRKQLRAYCREHNIDRLEIKKRGVQISPDRLRKEIVSTGDRSATIVVAPVQQQIRAIVAQRLASHPRG